jgi:hypothetical protein
MPISHNSNQAYRNFAPFVRQIAKAQRKSWLRRVDPAISERMWKKGSERESVEMCILRGFLKGPISAPAAALNNTFSPEWPRNRASLWK